MRSRSQEKYQMLCIGGKRAQEIVARRLLFNGVKVGVKVAKTTGVWASKKAEIPARVVAKQVFEVDSGRLGIGVFSRPLLDKEMRRFRAAWEARPSVGMEACEVDPQRVSFVAHPDGVPGAWDRIDSLLAAATGKAKKVA